MSDSITTTLTPAPDRRLATVADVRPWLMPSDVPSDDDLNALIGRASDLIAGACNGRVFGRESLRQIVWPGRLGVEVLLLSREPVAAISSLVVDGTALTQDTDFVLDPKNGLVFRLAGDARCGWRGTKITVEYTAGWLLPSQEASDLPGDVRQICIDRVVRMRGGLGRDPNVRSEGVQDVGQVSYFDPDKLSSEEMKGLAQYVIRRL